MADWRYNLAIGSAPLIRRAPRFRQTLSKFFVGDTRRWEERLPPDKRYQVFFDRTIRAFVYADLKEWAGRSHFIQGEHYDRTQKKFLMKFLREGDTFVDIGANIGVITATAAQLVGPRGRVYSFEPNPGPFEITRAVVAINHLQNCRVFNLGLSDQEATLSLQLLSEDSQAMTLRSVDGDHPKIEVPVVRAESALSDLPAEGRVVIKIDTEGFEHRVIRGLGSILDRDNLALYVEITDDWLRQTGTSAAELFADLRAKGFRSFHPSMASRRIRRALKLTPLDSPLKEFQYDMIFVKGDFLPETPTTGRPRQAS